MVTISIKDKEMVLAVKGMHKLWALKSEMIIPIEQVAEARLNNNEVVKPEGWRAPGAYIPGLIVAGTYRAHGDKVFWDVVNPNKSIIINLKNSEYTQLILEVENPETIVNEINCKISADSQ